MKVMLSIVVVLVLVLTFGVVYGAEKAEVSMGNGITYSYVAPTECASVRGAGAGGVIPWAEPLFTNGITHFELAVPGSMPTGLCAGASRIEAPKPWMNNGITSF